MANRAVVYVREMDLADMLACRGRAFEPGVQIISDAPEDLKIIGVFQDTNDARHGQFALLCESEEFPETRDGEIIPAQTITYHLERMEPSGWRPVPE